MGQANHAYLKGGLFSMVEKKVVKKKVVKKKTSVKKEPEITTSKTEVITPQIAITPPRMCVWRKKEGGTFRLANGRKVKPNETFEAYPSDIPEAFRDLFDLVDGDVHAVERIITAPSKFAVKAREDGLFDVEDINGKCINDTPMEKEDAERLQIVLST